MRPRPPPTRPRGTATGCASSLRRGRLRVARTAGPRSCCLDVMRRRWRCHGTLLTRYFIGAGTSLELRGFAARALRTAAGTPAGAAAARAHRARRADWPPAARRQSQSRRAAPARTGPAARPRGAAGSRAPGCARAHAAGVSPPGPEHRQCSAGCESAPPWLQACLATPKYLAVRPYPTLILAPARQHNFTALKL